ncbi:MAG: hypothetical protein ACHQ2E_05525 [Gemmatimonadales bacterium]
MYRSIFSDLSVLRQAFGLAAVALVTACSSSTGPSSAIPLDTEFELAPGHSAVVGANGLRIQFISVPLDTRCPMGVLCIVAGEAQVQISATQGTEASTLTLSTDALRRQTVFLSYSIQLIGVTPERHQDPPNPPSSYRAQLKVSLLGPD